MLNIYGRNAMVHGMPAMEYGSLGTAVHDHG